MFGDKMTSHCYHNGNIVTFDKIDEEKLKLQSDLIYEVVRVIDGKPLFWKEHLTRINNSFEKIGIDLSLSPDELTKGAMQIIGYDGLNNNNIKIIIGFLHNNLEILIYNIKSSYPDVKMYTEGVSVREFNYTRHNPNAKIVNLSYKEQVKNILQSENLYELLLVDEKGRITEGSRSNVFFIKENIIYTPKSSHVLLGITRLKLMDLLDRMGILLIEDDIYVKDISKYEGAFLTGTSINALPISRIGDRTMGTCDLDLFRSLLHEFNKEVEKGASW